MSKTELSKFTSYADAAVAIVQLFNEEHGLSERKRISLRNEVAIALEKDGKLPNDYEIKALNGCVPEDGTEEDGVTPKYYGFPSEVIVKFSHTHAVIEAQF